MAEFVLSDTQRAYGESLMRFIDASPTPGHAVQTTIGMLEDAGFAVIDEAEPWPTAPGRYIVVRDASLIAFATRSTHTATSGFSIIGAHTDSPNLRLKPNPDTGRGGLAQLGVEVYGGVLLNSWLDRDLGVAGEAMVRTGNGIEPRRYRIDEPLLRVPQLAIHLDREINSSGLLLNKQQHLAPLWAHADAVPGGFSAYLADTLGVMPSALVAFSAMAYDLAPSVHSGVGSAFISAPRIDNLLSCHMAVETLLRASDLATDTVPLIALFDHEEVGSSTANGAASPLLGSVIDRIGAALGATTDDLARARSRSLIVSADGAHATHPNYPDRHEPSHQVALNAGPVIKINANERYATTVRTHAAFAEAAAAVDVDIQHFVTRTDLACGSTIGPIASTATGISAVDVGAPQLAMHSIRELCGAADPELFHRAVLALLTSR